MLQNRLPLASALLCGFFILIQAAISMWINDGHFVYALDDAYIHLDLADQLGRTGIYGVNPGLYASPSSSILWPFLLAPFAPLGLLPIIPLLIGLASTMLAGWLMPEFIHRITGKTFSATKTLTLSFLAVLGLDMPALALCGMEHVLHVAIALLLALGVIRAMAGEPARWWFWAAVFISPLLRYEGAFISAGALGVLFWLGRWRSTLLAGILMLVPVALFSWFLLSHGMEILPSSTIVKKLRWESVENPFWFFWIQSVMAIFINNSDMINTTGAMQLIGAFTGLTIVLVNWRSWRSANYAVGLAITGVLFGQIFLGRFSIWETPRYEFYAMGFVVPLGLYAIRDRLMRPALQGSLLVILTLSALPALWSSSIGIHGAIRAIYLQQYQMGRLARDFFDGNVAVNDIGLPGYGNPHFVFDMVGLADPQARRARFAGGPDWADKLIRQHNVPLIMIYRSWWKPELRAHWTAVGELFRATSSKLGDDSVIFYTPYPEQIPAIQAQIRRWAETLPAGASYQEYSDQHPAPPDPQPDAAP